MTRPTTKPTSSAAVEHPSSLLPLSAPTFRRPRRAPNFAAHPVPLRCRRSVQHDYDERNTVSSTTPLPPPDDAQIGDLATDELGREVVVTDIRDGTRVVRHRFGGGEQDADSLTVVARRGEWGGSSGGGEQR
jgi:hypothetical protein